MTEFKSAFRAGQQAYANKVHKWVRRLIELAGIIVAAVGQHYALPWFAIVALETVLVLVPAVLLIYHAARKV
jgi:hypothetical protein